MKLPIVDNWRAILRRAWTVWLAALAAVAGFVEVTHADILAALPALTPYLGDSQAAKVAALAAALLPLARIVKQATLEGGK